MSSIYRHVTRTFIEREDGRFLALIRKHMIGCAVTNVLILPGGVVEENEDPFTGNVREVFEEVGVTLHDTKLLSVLDMVKNYEHLRPSDPRFSGEQTYRYHFYTARADQEPVLKEPEKFEGLHWVTQTEMEKLKKTYNCVIGDGIDVALTIRTFRQHHPDSKVV